MTSFGCHKSDSEKVALKIKKYQCPFWAIKSVINEVGYCYLPSHSLKSVILSPLTNTSCLGGGTRSNLSFPPE